MLISRYGILRFSGELHNHRSGVVFLRSCHIKSIPVTWKKPEFGWTKLNFDGSCKGKSGKASIGGVFRNHDTEFLLGYAESIGYASSTNAKWATLRRGLELALENGWSDVWIEGDAKNLIDSIVKSKEKRCAESQRHLLDIKSMIPELKNCAVTHTYREGNRTADKFAQLGHFLEQPKVWHNSPPDEVLPLVHQDANGKIVLRKKKEAVKISNVNVKEVNNVGTLDICGMKNTKYH